MKGLLILVIGLHFFAHASFAADDNGTQTSGQELANPFSDYVPFEDEYDIDEDERFMYFGRFFAISMGTGIHRFSGNMGILYNDAIPVFDFKVVYFFDFRLAGQFGVSTASHAFDASPSGVVEVNLLRINADMKYYFDTRNTSATITMANPYVVGGISNVFRTQTFQTKDAIEKDTAFAFSVGAGMEFALKPRKTSLGFEGRLHQIYFKDRYSQLYSESGVPDMTGNMYSFTTSIIFFF